MSLLLLDQGKSLFPSGIASAEAFGDGLITANENSLSPSGIPSAESFSERVLFDQPLHYSVDTGTEGLQLRKITAKGVTINFSDHPMGSVGTIEDHYNARTRQEFSTSDMFDDGSATNGKDIDQRFQKTLGDVSGAQKQFDFDIDVRADEANGALVLTPSIAMDASKAPDWSFDYCSLELKIQLPGNGNPETCRVMLPDISQRLYQFTDTDAVPVGSENKRANPGPSNKGGPTISYFEGILAYDEPKGKIQGSGAANSQAIYIYCDETKDGFMVRTNDNVGQNKILSIERSGDDCIIRVRFIPQDNSIGVNNLSDSAPFDYSVNFCPMNTDFNGALRYDAARKEDEGFPAFDQLPINHPSSTFPSKAKSAVCFSWLNSGGVGFDFSKFVEQNQRIKKHFNGQANSVLSFWYGSEPANLNEFAPTMTPFNGNFVEQVAAAIALQQTVVVYTFPCFADKDVLDALDLGILQDVARTRTGYVWESAPSVPASELPPTEGHTNVDGRSKYISFTFDDAENNAEYIRYIVQQFAGVGIHGFYMDVEGLYGATVNDDPNAASANRGSGTKTWMTGKLSLSDLMRTESDIPDDEAIIAHEWPCEFSVGKADIFFWNSLGAVNEDGNQLFGPSVQYGDRILSSTFNHFGQGLNEELSGTIPGVVDIKEIFNGYYIYWFMGGHLMPVSAYWAFRDEYFIALKGEQDYDDWFEEALPHYSFINRLYWKQQDLTRRFHRSKRLWEMPNTSGVVYNIEKYFGVTGTQSDYLFSQGWHDKYDDLIGICCANPTLTLEEGGFLNITETWSDRIDVNDFPELGLSSRKVQLIDCETGEVTQMADYDGSGGYAMPDVVMTPGRVVWLVMGDYVHVGPGYIELEGQGQTVVELVAEGQTVIELVGN